MRYATNCVEPLCPSLQILQKEVEELPLKIRLIF